MFDIALFFERVPSLEAGKSETFQKFILDLRMVAKRINNLC